MLRQPPAHQCVTGRISVSVLRPGGLKRKLRVRGLPEIGYMTAVIALAALALMGVVLGSAWRRRDELELTGEWHSMVLGLLLCFVCVMLILVATGTLGW